MRLVLLAALALVSASCSKASADNTPGPIPMTSPTPLPATTAIEFRVLGDVGNVPVKVSWSDPVDGTTLAPSVSLPYLATVSMKDTEAYLTLSAQANAVYGGTLQVQIIVAGRVFREDFESGAGALTASVGGTWRTP